MRTILATAFSLSAICFTSEIPAELPGATNHPLGHLKVTAFQPNKQPACEKGTFVVSENRAAASSRPIELQFYRFKARTPSGRAPVFVLPGGPGGWFDDNIAKLVQMEFQNPDSKLALFLQQRDVILMNQRGARAPDRRYQTFGFLVPPARLEDVKSADDHAEALRRGAKNAITNWSEQGVDVAGYDIMNMVEDIEELREALKYDSILLRGTSFGSQWSFSYMQAHPDRVDRAVLGGIEPIDFGYDSPQGIWNVFRRLEQRLLSASGPDNHLRLPDVLLTDAIKQIVARLEKAPIQVSVDHPRTGDEVDVAIGPHDFQGLLRRGIAARRESQDSLGNFPKFIFEILNEDYDYLVGKVAQSRMGFNGASLQSLCIDNSLGISSSRERQLNDEEPRKWLGELNLAYKATRDETRTPVVPDAFRTLQSDIPILIVHGDLDLSTPIENAEAAMTTLTNAHLIRITDGTHGALDQMLESNAEFRELMTRFLDADFEASTVGDLELPDELALPEIQFAPITAPSLGAS